MRSKMDLEAALAQIKDYEEKTTDLTSQIEALKRNNESLVSEKRSVSEQKRQIEEDSRKKAEDLAKATGDYDSIVTASKEKEAQALKELNELRQTVADEKISNLAAKLANEIAFDANAASLLEEQFVKRLTFEDNQVKIKHKEGSTVSNFEQLKDEFVKTDRFKALIKGNPASGGRSAIAAGSSGSHIDTSRKLSPVERLNRSRGV